MPLIPRILFSDGYLEAVPERYCDGLAEGLSGRGGRDSTEVFESFAEICHVDPDRIARPDFADIDGQNATSNLRPLVSEQRDRCRMLMNERRFARSRAAHNVLIFRDGSACACSRAPGSTASFSARVRHAEPRWLP